MKKRTFNKESNIKSSNPSAPSASHSLSSPYKSQANILKRKTIKELDEEHEEVDLNSKLMKYKELEFIYQKTHIKPIYFAYVLIFLLVLIIFGIWDDLLTCIIGVLFPMYASIKTIKSGERDQIKQWLTYWVVFAIFLNLECMFGWMIKYVQLYFFYKTVFLLICFLPQYNGCKWIYEIVVKDIFYAYEADVYDMSVTLTKKLTTIHE